MMYSKILQHFFQYIRDICPNLCRICLTYTKREGVVAARLSAHTSEHNHGEPHKSTYKPNHSVEAARVCLQNGNLLSMNNQNVAISIGQLHLTTSTTKCCCKGSHGV